MENINWHHNFLKRNNGTILAKRIRSFPGLQFSKPSPIFDDLGWANNVENEYMELPQDIIKKKLQKFIDDIGQNGLNKGIGNPRRKSDFVHKQKQKNKEQEKIGRDFYTRDLSDMYRLMYDEKIENGKKILYIISISKHYKNR